jgi:uncharacterized protein YggU (UPF0235/DUF167 family)
MKEGIRTYEGGVLFNIVVKPNARKQSIKVSKKSGIVISVTSPRWVGTPTGS